MRHNIDYQEKWRVAGIRSKAKWSVPLLVAIAVI